jgi:nucleoside-diphosphate kinase
MTEDTLLLIKPDAIAKRKIGAILNTIEDEGFEIIALKMFTMEKETAKKLYSVHEGKHYYERLIRFMTGSKIVAAILTRDNAISHLRTVVGDTDPSQAEEGTIRNLYGDHNTITYNAVHASDSPSHAAEETAIIFPEL